MNQRNETLLIALGKKIRELREKKEMSMDDLAAECEIEKQQLHRIETGKVNTTVSSLYVIAKGLGVPISDLIKGM
jgi:transcriptional regulator with XRE-family HTH domain